VPQAVNQQVSPSVPAPTPAQSAPQPHQSLFQRLFYATGCVFELARGVIIFAVLLALINVFVGTVNVVNGSSMESNFHNGQYVVIDKITYLLRSPKRGEVVVLKFPGDPDHTRYIKRVIGLPGETLRITDSQVYINDKPINEPYIDEGNRTEPDMEIKLGPNEYFMMGDNRENSNDSRAFKSVERRFIIGLAYVVIFPTRDAHLVPPQFYPAETTTEIKLPASSPNPSSP
jgi:signal peptidase I